MQLPDDADTYIATFTAAIQQRLQEMRSVIKKAAPEAVEVISYGMPAFKQHSVLVYFAGYKSHTGFYPTASGIEAFKDRLAGYQWSKGAIQFPHDQLLPTELINQIVAFRLKDDAERAMAKKTKKSLK